MILEDVRLYFGQQEVSERCVYLTRPEYLKTALEKNCALILVGGEPLADLPVFSAVLSFRSLRNKACGGSWN